MPFIAEDIVTNHRKPDPTPDPGAYHPSFKTFGSDIKPTIHLDKLGPYPFHPKEGPGPGSYETDSILTKSSIKGGMILPEPPRIYSLNVSLFNPS
jgi:hypothetical protein